MKVKEVMTQDVRIANTEETIQEAARMMANLDAGALPVGENDKLVGMITDRDIAIRGVAQGKSPSAKVREVMTPGVKYCFEDQEIEEITQNMGDLQVRRLPVVDRNKRLVGFLSLADVALCGEGKVSEALGGISRPGGEHSQTAQSR